MRRNTDGCIFILLYKQDTVIWNGDIDFICFGVVLNQYGNTPFQYACKNGTLEAILRNIKVTMSSKLFLIVTELAVY